MQIRSTANETLDGIEYDFQVASSPDELKALIFNKNQERNRARITAGYCWDWLSKQDKAAMDITFPNYSFSMQWNLVDDGMLWLMKEDSVEQVGCIHTCQGLELDYVGVVLGPDFLIRDGKVVCDATARSSNDSSVRGYKKMLKENREKALQLGAEVIKNTYRTLMTRGQSGCFVWSVDEETNQSLRLATRQF